MASRRGGYDRTTTGLANQFFDFRLSSDGESRPVLVPGQLWEDPGFSLHAAIPDPAVTQSVSWKRPKDISSSPQLFTDGATRFDIGQGEIGTCWFLSMVTTLSEHPKLLAQVIPADAYSPVDSEDYDGVFNARFWRFGKWEDVFVDDHLPVFRDMPWGARSASDPNEFWVSLLEKAFAKYHGNYHAVFGGHPGDAYVTLTGGVAEMLDYEEDVDSGWKVFHRVSNALKAGCLVAAAVAEEHHDIKGLQGKHAYSVTGAAQAKGVSLLRIRNPWGTVEWTGAWSDGSDNWQGVGQSEVPRAARDDGEFWTCLEDFLRYFSQITVCSLTPDFDQDGVLDSLNYVTNIYGEWIGATAAGFQNKLKNPRIFFTVPNTGSEQPVVVQLIQERESRKSENLLIRCDVYKVVNNDGPCAVVQILGEKTNSYSQVTQCSFRHKLGAGTYVIVPSTAHADEEKSYLIRIFSAIPISGVWQVPSKRTLIESKPKTVSARGQNFSLDCCKVANGQWKAGVNAGGQISHRETHASNPQYVISVSQMAAVEIKLAQQDDPRVPLGMCLFPTGDAPMDITTIYKMLGDRQMVMDLEDKPYTFVGNAPEVESRFLLTPGDYTLLVHTDEPDKEKAFAVLVSSSADLTITTYQTGL